MSPEETPAVEPGADETGAVEVEAGKPARLPRKKLAPKFSAPPPEPEVVSEPEAPAQASAPEAKAKPTRGKAPAKKTGEKKTVSEKPNNLQDMFLNALRKSKTPVTMFLVKGVKLQGIITWFDNFSVLLRRDGQSQLIYKHAISTVMPAHPIDLAPIEKAFAETKRSVLLQEIFLNAVKASGDPVTMFLVNGVMLQGDVAAYDLFCLLLRRDGQSQLVYKHAISTVQPLHPVNLSGVDDEEDD
jgi:host factor-I protein